MSLSNSPRKTSMVGIMWNLLLLVPLILSIQMLLNIVIDTRYARLVPLHAFSERFDTFIFVRATEYTFTSQLSKNESLRGINTTQLLSYCTLAYDHTNNAINWKFFFEFDEDIGEETLQFTPIHQVDDFLANKTASQALATFNYFRLIHKNIISTQYRDQLFIPSKSNISLPSSVFQNADGMDLSFNKMLLHFNGSIKNSLVNATKNLEIPELFVSSYYLQWFVLDVNLSQLAMQLDPNVLLDIAYNISSRNPTYTLSTLEVIRDYLSVQTIYLSEKPMVGIGTGSSPVVAFAWNSWKLWFVLVVVIVMLLGLIASLWRPYYVVIVALVVFNLAGIISLSDTLAGFSNSGTIIVALLFPIVKPLAQNTLVLKMSKILFGSPLKFKSNNAFLQYVSLMPSAIRISLVFTIFSAFVSNTPVVATGMPIVMEWARRHNLPASKFLMILCYTVSGGGLLTLLGTSASIVANGIYTQYGYQALTFYEFVYVGSILAVITILYSCTYVLWAMPNEVRENNSKKVAQRTFANKSKQKININRERKELFLSMVNLAKLESEKETTKANKFYKSILGKKKKKVISIVGKGLELVEVIRKKETTPNTANIGSEPLSNETEVVKEVSMTNTVTHITDIPESYRVENTDILVFRGLAVDILHLHTLIFSSDILKEQDEAVSVSVSSTTESSDEKKQEVPTPTNLLTVTCSTEDMGRISQSSTSSSNDQLLTESPIHEGNPVTAQLHNNMKKVVEEQKRDSQKRETSIQDSTQDKAEEKEKELEFFEVVVSSSNPCIGGNYENFEKRYRVSVLAIRHLRFTESNVVALPTENNVHEILVQSGDTVLLVGKSVFYFNYHESSKDFYAIARFSDISPTLNKNTQKPFQFKIPFTDKVLDLFWWEHWIFIFFIAMIACAIAGFQMVQCTLVTFCVVVLFGLITPTSAVECVEWRLVTLVGASFGIAAAITQSGMAEALTEILRLMNMPVILLPACITLITLAVTAVITNNAAVAICLPLGLAVAKAYGLNPRCFAMCVSYAASSVFMTPIGYQSNMLIMGPGGFTFLDYVKGGTFLTIIYWVCISIFVPLIWGLERPNF